MCEETIAKPKDNFFETTMTKTSEDFVWKIGNFSEIQHTANKNLLPGTGNYLTRKFTDEKGFSWWIRFYPSNNKVHRSTKYKTYRCDKNKYFEIDYNDTDIRYNFVQSDDFLNLKFSIEYTNLCELSGFKSETRTE
eukprot:GHVP01002578.1.p1 GENE.GHVP01002578.1~~GHVP01002578.1.p1  ORF type:complete len:136 (-),score=21.51 GHVP01002578.1:167-574(-)